MQNTQQYTSILNLIKNCKSISQSYSLLPLIRMFNGTEFSNLVFELRNVQDSICKRDLNKWNNRKTQETITPQRKVISGKARTIEELKTKIISKANIEIGDTIKFQGKRLKRIK